MMSNGTAGAVRKMRFLHVSTGDDRGAYSGAYRLHRNLIDAGHESVMLVGSKATSDPSVFAPPAWAQRVRLLGQKACSLVSMCLFGADEQRARIFKWGLPFVRLGAVSGAAKSFKPDLVIVYYVADFLSEAQLAELRRRISAPMAFYLMDMGMLTGACHYAWECEGYRQGCSQCPATGSRWVRGAIALKWMSKDRHYRLIQPTIVSGSEMLDQQVRGSALCRAYSREKILMGVSSDLYNPQHRPAAREVFGLKPDDLVFYFGAQNVDDRRKGFAHLVQALQQLNGSLGEDDCARLVLFTVGDRTGISQLPLPFRHVHRGYIADPALFSRTYAAADLFICPSVEDSGPMMINESIMSGTPVASFDMGVAKDLVVDGQTGFRVPVGDVQELARALERFVRLTAEQRMEMGAAARQLGLEKCSSRGQVEAFERLAMRLQLH